MSSNGIDSYQVEEEFICKEWCSDCSDEGTICDNVFIEDVWHDRHGIADTDITCRKCNHTWTRMETW